jgi:hypothetical protein
MFNYQIYSILRFRKLNYFVKNDIQNVKKISLIIIYHNLLKKDR